MASWRYDPYLWIHLAGLATVPLWMGLCLLGLAVGDAVSPALELAIIIGLGVLPVLGMQLRRPFYIFSLPGLALRPAALNDDQRRQLSQFHQWRVRLGALLVPVPLVWMLLKLYPIAFLARDITPFGGWGRLGGIAAAGLCFLLANLFLQVPLAVLQVLATPDRHMATLLPYPSEAIANDFSWLGLPVNKLLPDITPLQTEKENESTRFDSALEHHVSPDYSMTKRQPSAAEATSSAIVLSPQATAGKLLVRDIEHPEELALKQRHSPQNHASKGMQDKETPEIDCQSTKALVMEPKEDEP
ncbi:MAG: low-complexity tail membrane protein [Nodosilinea sp.]